MFQITGRGEINRMKKLVVLALVALGVPILAFAGVEKIRSNGKLSGVPSYQVTCSSGSTYIIYRKNETWYRGDMGHMGNKFDTYSKEEVAKYVCK